MSKIRKRTRRDELMGEVAQQHPTWSLRQIEAHLNLKPLNYAGHFKENVAARENEQRDYEQRLAAWEARNNV